MQILGQDLLPETPRAEGGQGNILDEQIFQVHGLSLLQRTIKFCEEIRQSSHEGLIWWWPHGHHIDAADVMHVVAEDALMAIPSSSPQ